MDKPVYYFPAVRNFKDTGYVEHAWADNSSVRCEVIKNDKENSSEPFLIKLIIKSGNQIITDVDMGRFEALCLADTIIKSLLNQEEVTQAEIEEFNKRVDNEYSNN